MDNADNTEKIMGKSIYIIGIGGRTGVMFGRELQASCEITGIGMEREISAINGGKVKIRRGGNASEVFNVPAVKPENFGAIIENKSPDFVWMAVRNPVTEAVKFYYRHFQGKKEIPALILSQNGLSAIKDAQAALAEVLGQAGGRVRIIRVSLINGVDLKMKDDTAVINYKIPIKLGAGAVNGESINDLKEVFSSAGIKCQEFRGKKVLDMENSKLFMNLIGMAAAVNGIPAGVGLRDEKIFKEETAMLKEFVAAVKKSGGGFADDFAGYPIKFLAQTMLLPIWLLTPFRGLFADIVAKGRNRPKDLSEIDYYNGEVVKLGKQFSVSTPVNEKITAKAKEIRAQAKI
jgi:ketopantoate reductase